MGMWFHRCHRKVPSVDHVIGQHICKDDLEHDDDDLKHGDDDLKHGADDDHMNTYLILYKAKNVKENKNCQVNVEGNSPLRKNSNWYILYGPCRRQASGVNPAPRTTPLTKSLALASSPATKTCKQNIC